MKQRLISAIIALFLFIPILWIGKLPFTIAIYVLSILGLKEYLKMKEVDKELPMFISFISYLALTFLVLFNRSKETLVFSIDFRVITAIFLVFLIPTVLYHDSKKYSIVDAFYLIGGIFFLGTSFSLMIALRDWKLSMVLYLFLITIVTDSYAYITGKLIGKHKLLEEISPKKTLEGTIGGTLFGVFIGMAFYHTVIDPELSLITLALITLFLSILGQLGDLFFSAIKRYYGKKDFSNLMPGHGGILDRLDSIIFVVLGFMFFITIL